MEIMVLEQIPTGGERPQDTPKRRLGDDELFFEILREYYQQFAGSNASTADFIAVAESVSDQELDDLFDSWLFEPGVPPKPQIAAAE